MNLNYVILSFSFFIYTISFSQNRVQVEKVLRQIHHFHQIDSLKKAHPRWEMKAETLSSNDTVNFPFLRKPVLGEIYKTTLESTINQSFMVKILKQEIQHLCRVQYIFLDGDKLKMYEIDSIRTEIHRRIRRGEKFLDMISEYNMDGGTGDIGWFSKEMVVSEFFDPIVAQQKGEVFDISIPKNRWYYVVHKTHENYIKKLFYTLWIKIE